MTYRVLLLFFLMSLAGMVTGQDYSITNKSAIKKFTKALDLFQNREDDKALSVLGKVLAKEPTFLEAYLLRSEIYHERGNSELELLDLEKIQSIDPAFKPGIAFFIGEEYYKQAKYERALSALENFMSVGDEEKKLARASFLIACCEFAIQSIAQASPIDLIPLGNQVNTPYNDMMPALTADESMLIFTVDIPLNESKPYSQYNRQEDFFIARKKGERWQAAENMGPPINTAGNEGALSISADGTVLVFASSNLPDGFGSTDLYTSNLKNGKWSTPVNLGDSINTKHWESQPSISSDGNRLYFISNRPGGSGKMDIWYSEKNESGQWKAAVNLGETINTKEEENSPFIHHDGRTLYFGSTGQIGFGGFDLYKVNVSGANLLSDVMNLGSPINTEKNEEFLIINTRGNLAFLSSERTGSRNKDLYYFEIPQAVRPDPVSYVSGRVYDASGNSPLVASFTLVDLSTGKTIIESQSNEQGNYLVCLPSGKDYAFQCAKEGYLFYSANFKLDEETKAADPFQLDIPLQPVQTGKSVILRNVFFATNEYLLDPKSELELNQLITFMNENPGIKIEIGGHTDNQGNQSYNQLLSENRAKSVFQYLINHGISSQRVSYKGYGMSMPIRENDSEEGRAFNRRTEFTIVSTSNKK